MDIVPFSVEHLKGFQLQLAQREVVGYLGSIVEYARLGEAFTALTDKGVIGIGGILPYWPGRVHAWAVLNEAAGRHMLAIHRAVRAFFSLCDARRIETTVNVGFPEGHRWALMLGFTREGVLRSYTPAGDDVILYARIKEAGNGV